MAHQGPGLHQELADVRQRIVHGKRRLAELDSELQGLAKRMAAVRSELDADERWEAQLLSALAGGRQRRRQWRRGAAGQRGRKGGLGDCLCSNFQHVLVQELVTLCSSPLPCTLQPHPPLPTAPPVLRGTRLWLRCSTSSLAQLQLAWQQRGHQWRAKQCQQHLRQPQWLSPSNRPARRRLGSSRQPGPLTCRRPPRPQLQPQSLRLRALAVRPPLTSQ